MHGAGVRGGGAVARPRARAARQPADPRAGLHQVPPHLTELPHGQRSQGDHSSELLLICYTYVALFLSLLNAIA